MTTKKEGKQIIVEQVVVTGYVVHVMVGRRHFLLTRTI